MKRQDRRSDCPINFALELFGDTWTLLIIRDLMLKEKRTFGEFLRSEERIATNVLTARLRSLEEAGLIRKDGAMRTARYRLTRKGIDLLPMMLEMIEWSAKYDAGTAAPRGFVQRLRKDKRRLIDELRAKAIFDHENDRAARTPPGQPARRRRSTSQRA